MRYELFEKIYDIDSNMNIKEILLATIKSIVQAIGERDRYTRKHSENVAAYAKIIANELRLSQDEIEKIYLAGLFHDIGKIGIPDYILNKPGKLNDEELMFIKEHPRIACRILESFDIFKDILPAIEQHHEQWNGSGYPFGLIGESIDLGARIIAVADAFDAMITDRVYRKGMKQDEAIDNLIKGAGQQWDPEIVDVFVRWWEKMYNPQGKHDWKLKYVRTIYKDFLNDATEGKVILLDESDIEKYKEDYKVYGEMPVLYYRDLIEARKLFNEFLDQLDINKEKQRIYILVFSELVNNILKHAERGMVEWGIDNFDDLVLTVNDYGPGFLLEKLPQSLLISGFCTTNTLKSVGLGLPFVLKYCKKLTIANCSGGTFISVKLTK
ncbi:HDIG domain-containing protein [Carboxydocella sporoproducens DSM 16521]|uniref:HDIG domain-containing protein n=2 Tax=Carboxydocella TaxID=178898 RepID=A0A1T4S919_9FIRM|nr:MULTISPECIES: HD domain-containing phosphohydrolase [Carboxydocella]AVX20121.1 HDIG domain-containing protein [Carboxydocella thermautotrophica]AVX30540.1 HDIG domain-containing protein [Carboxydocella thermautotrophica]SKA24715.1 HDIG domain-containing protein [Carboxydocella sporoproducens DSM 16521]